MSKSDARWHRLVPECPKCRESEKMISLKSVSISADGDILIDLHCLTCKEDFGWTAPFAEWTLRAQQADLNQGDSLQENKRKGNH